MKRIELIYNKLKELYNEDGCGLSTYKVAESLNLNRANVSSDLNRLVENGKAIKVKGKPTLFTPKEISAEKNTISIIDKFAEKNASLYTAVEQAKAAILYPPNGMNILLLGETGVGKSTFASIIYKYAIEMKIKDSKMPFITFNCADYASNPQLLLGQLFGIKKGAYTGAEFDKEGLLEKANGGILFLDEVHRLPAEGQEMFFAFMDKGMYRRLGETESERTAKVLIITATTEDPDTSLLKTFTRRIPMVITMPPLNKRGMEERFNLLKQFMLEESNRLKRSIKVSINSIKAFLSYNCPSNIGQLKSDIQLACAKAYAEFLSNKKGDIIINSLDLPSYIREGLYKETEHRQLWNRLIDINVRYYIFDKDDKEEMFFEESENQGNIYEMIDTIAKDINDRGIKGIYFEEEMDREIESYFEKFMSKFNNKLDITNIKNIIEPDIIKVIEKVISFCEDSMGRKFEKKIYYGLAVHIGNSINRIRRNKKIINPKLNSIRQDYEREFNIALDALKIIDKTIDISMPFDEAGFVTMFLIYKDGNEKSIHNEVRIIIIAHGVSTASSMADAVNNLLGSKNIIGINAPIEETPKKVLEKTIQYIERNSIKSDILFLVDMGSLTTFGKEIENKFEIKTRTIPLVSTLHAMEASRKATIGYSLDEIYKETLEVNNLYDNNILEHEPKESEDRKLAIITICTTGEGGAKTMKRLLDDVLSFDLNLLHIIPLNFIGKESIYDRIENIKKNYEIICLVGPFKLETNYPQFMLDDIIEKKCIDKIQKLIDIENTYINMAETLDHQLKNISGKIVLKDIKKFNNTISESLNIKISTNILIGISFHMACMIDRLKDNILIEEYEGKHLYIELHNDLYRLIKITCTSLNTKYSISISDDEICCLMNFFKAQK